MAGGYDEAGVDRFEYCIRKKEAGIEIAFQISLVSDSSPCLCAQRTHYHLCASNSKCSYVIMM